MKNDNRDVYRDTQTASHYGHMQGLFPPEQTAFASLAERYRNAKILDLGVGGGRTTPHLRALSEDYVGVDYSEAMVEICRRTFPGVRFEVGDARSLTAFGDGYFDLVVFSFNGIDYVTHAERLKVLQEIHRITRDGGELLFSSHNAGFRARRDQPLLRRAIGTLKDRVFRRSPVFDIGRHTTGNGSYHYRIEPLYATKRTLKTYYIAAAAQAKQLQEHGFVCEKIIDTNGNVAGANGDSTSPWLYYLAHKSGAFRSASGWGA